MRRTDLAALLGAAPAAVAAGHAAAWLLAMEGEARAPKAADGPYALARGVAIMPIRGVLTKRSAWASWMGWATYEGIEAAMRELAASADVSAIVLDMDSPGGAAYGVAAAAQAVAEAAKAKPLYAFVDPIAASAAYHIASQARDIVLSPGAAVGSIGIVTLAGKPVAPDGAGDQWFEMTSSHAPNKRPDPQTEAGRAALQSELDALEAAFIADAARGRGVSVAVVRENFGRGGMVTDQAAVAAGMADRIAGRAAFYDAVLTAHGAGASTAPRRALGAQALAAAASARAAL